MSTTEYHEESFYHYFCLQINNIGFALGLCAIQPLVLGHPSSVRHGIHLMEQSLSQIRCRLITPMNFVPPSSQHVLQAGQIVGQKVYDLLGVYTCLWQYAKYFSVPKNIKHIGVKVLCRHQLTPSVFSDLYRCYIQQLGLTVSLQRQRIVLTIAWVLWGFLWNLLANNPTGYSPVLPLEGLFGDKRQLIETLSIPLFENFIRIAFIYFKKFL